MPSKEKLVRRSIDLLTLSAVALVSSCTPRPEPQNVRTVGTIEEEYRQAGEAQTRYENCMTRFFPNYREFVQQNGEVYLGGGDSGMPESPALEGCRTERAESARLRRLAFGYED